MVPRAEVFVRIGWWSVPLLAGVRGSVDETFSPVLPASNRTKSNVKHTWHKQHDAGSSMGCPTPRVSGNHRSSASLDDLDSLLLKYQQSNGDT